ncbi:uncharacterized protein LOC135124003 [Zophobas morio]|uniref:uncharacterized protein LOC135124003 n=1 Tax=Zophobas morio TaxID=2755281 RepID=UPI003082C84D
MAPKSFSMYLLSLIVAINIVAIMATHTHYDPNKVYTIRPVHDKTVALHTRNPSQVQLQIYSHGKAFSLFHIQHSHEDRSLYHLVSEPTGEVMDVHRRTKSVIMSSRNGSLRQLWYLTHDNRIVNADTHLALTLRYRHVENGHLKYGTPLIVSQNNGSINQEFKIWEDLPSSTY